MSATSNEPVVAIDLVTTHCIAAFLQHGKPTLIASRSGKNFTQSAVLYAGENKKFIGEMALDEFATGQYPSKDLIEQPKRLRGKR